MKATLLALFCIAISQFTNAQTTHSVCISEVYSTGACNSTSGIFTPGNLVIQQGDQIEFTTYMVLLGGYNGTHDIQFAGSPANNVTLPISTNILAPVTTVTTPPFNTPGVFSMECHDSNHCLIADLIEGWQCDVYSVTVVANCPIVPGFTTAPATTVCTGEVLDFTNTTTGATGYNWKLDGFTFATTQDATLSFGSAGNYTITMVADDGSCSDSTEVVINVDPGSDAGDDDSSQFFCNIDDSIDLNTLVNGDTGGFWEETTSSGQFNPTTAVFNYNALPEQDYTFNYIVPGVGVCPNDTATMTVEVNQEPSLTLILGPTPIANYDSLFIDFTTTNVVPGAQFLWSYCDGNLATDTLPHYYTWGVHGDFCVCVDVNNLNGCVETFCDSNVIVFDASNIEEIEELDVKVYPNPANGLFTIDLTNLDGDGELFLSDNTGRIVLRRKVQGHTNLILDSKQFAKGNYIIQIISENTRGITQIIFEE